MTEVYFFYEEKTRYKIMSPAFVHLLMFPGDNNRSTKVLVLSAVQTFFLLTFPTTLKGARIPGLILEMNQWRLKKHEEIAQATQLVKWWS